MDHDDTATPDAAPEAGAATVKRARRRAASRPAGPPTDAVPPATTGAPADEAGSESASGSGAVEPKKATRRTRKAPDPAPADEAAAPAPADEAAAPAKRTRRATKKPADAAAVDDAAVPAPVFVAPLFVAPQVDAEPVEEPAQPPAPPVRKRTRRASAAAVREAEPSDLAVVEADAEQTEPDEPAEPASEGDGDDDADETGADDGPRRRRRRGGRGRRRREDAAGEAGGDAVGDDDAGAPAEDAEGTDGTDSTDGTDDTEDTDDTDAAGSRRRRRRRRRGGDAADSGEDTGGRAREPRNGSDDVASLRGSTRLEAKKQRRREGREAGRRRAPILTEAEFLARRESVDRVMAVRQVGDRTQIAVLEDGVLVEHYVTRGSSASMVGNVYLGRVQNVLPSMEAAFVDIGRGRNAVLYAGEVNWDAAGLDGQPKRIEFALKSGDPVLVQVTKDPIGQKGARLTSQVSLPGRFLVYVPDGSMTGISRKLPDTERSRLKSILKRVMPEDAGVIVRTAAEGAAETALEADVTRLTGLWADIEAARRSASPPTLLYSEPDLAIKVVRDIFNEDVSRLVVAGDTAWASLSAYIGAVAPDLVERLDHWVGPTDLFAHFRVDEQLLKALDRKVFLPSGGSLVIDRTEAMTVVDVNTGKFTGQGGNLEQTVTRNNLEAAEEIVRQLRLRDIGGIIVVDFIDMVLESNRDLVLRRLVECLGRDRTKHQVAEVTSLGLVQMTRKRIGSGLLESFSTVCEHCNGRGIKVALDAEHEHETSPRYRRPAGAVDPADVAARALAAAEAESEPAVEPAVDPEPAAEPAVDLEPAAEPVVELVVDVEPAVDPEPAVEPAVDPEPEPAAEPAVDPV